MSPSQLQHDLPSQFHHPVINKKETRQTVLTDELELLIQSLSHPPIDTAVASRGRLLAEPLQPRLGIVARWRGHLREAVAAGHKIQRAEIGTPLRQDKCVGKRLRIFVETLFHNISGQQVIVTIDLKTMAYLA